MHKFYGLLTTFGISDYFQPFNVLLQSRSADSYQLVVIDDQYFNHATLLNSKCEE